MVRHLVSAQGKNKAKSTLTLALCLALSYPHTIETRKGESSREPGMPMHKLAKEEK